ncbi:hypothetical protein OSCT_0649 [Oscillochloris trichoides DG-6]|uniref:Uncharacterized protein n=1 Tax=Oscillochloris trichoides DG-6 TaxID=765420 RepID=E1IBE8_9CHLR|nr:hypothetical protein [Oscillochloris trichoides]EFO81505.1 hypothetical protein OSCT_0649 [Oscillochloris trichoides DG-6]
MNWFMQQRSWRMIGQQVGRLALVLALVLVTLLGVTVAAIGMQAQRDETRNADLLLLIAPELPPSMLIEHCLDLYRRGYGTQIAITGPGQVRARNDLLGRGVPAEALLDVGERPSLVAGLQVIQQRGVTSLLVASLPADQLLALKVAHDIGLRAYGSPEPALAEDFFETLRASRDYWRYALLRL